MLRTLATVLLWAVAIAIFVFVAVTVLRLTEAFLAKAGWAEKAGALGERVAATRESLEDKLEESLELV